MSIETRAKKYFARMCDDGPKRIGLERFCQWKFSKPVKRYFCQRNDRGRHISYFHGEFAGEIGRRRQILKAFRQSERRKRNDNKVDGRTRI